MNTYCSWLRNKLFREKACFEPASRAVSFEIIYFINHLCAQAPWMGLVRRRKCRYAADIHVAQWRIWL